MSARTTLTKPGWRTYRFEEIATNVNERVDDPSEAGVEYYVGLEHLDSDSLNIRRWGSPADVQATKLRFRKGDIVFGRRRVYQRKLGVAHFDGICSAHAMVLRAKPDVALVEFLPFFMQSDLFMERAKEISVGSLSPTINWPALAQEDFALPPLDEQRRIVAALRAIDTERSALQKAQVRLVELADAFVSGTLEQQSGRGSVISLAEGCLRVTDGTHQPPPFTSHGVPFFLVKTISRGFVDWTHTKFVSASTYAELTRRIRPKRGDVLYTAVGATYGVALLVDFDDDFAFQRHIAHIVPNTEKLLPRFVELFLNSRFGRRQSDSAAGGSAQPTVTLTALSRFAIPGLSIGEQKDLCDRVEELQSTRHGIDQRDKSLASLRENVMRSLSA